MRHFTLSASSVSFVAFVSIKEFVTCMGSQVKSTRKGGFYLARESDCSLTKAVFACGCKLKEN